VAQRDEALWAKIRDEYLRTGKSYSKLAKEHGVSLSLVKKYATREGWKTERDSLALARAAKAAEEMTGEPVTDELTEIAKSVTESVTAEIVTGQERVQRFMDVTDALMERIFDAVQNTDRISAQSLKFLTSALHDIWEMQRLNRSALDIEEQKARIEKLRADIRTPETIESRGITVEFVDTYGAET